MSAQQVFAYCFDCQEIGYGISDSNGVYTRDSGSSNHWDHSLHVFRTPNEYSPPLRKILASLHGGLPINVMDMQIMVMAVERGEVVPNGTADRDKPLDTTADPDSDQQWNDRFNRLLRLMQDPIKDVTHCIQCDRPHPANFKHCSHCGLASRFINPTGYCIDHKHMTITESTELPGQTDIFDQLKEITNDL